MAHGSDVMSASKAIGWLIALVLAMTWSAVAWGRSPDVELFTREGCSRCDEAKVFVRDLARRDPALVVDEIDVGRDPVARTRLSEIAAAHGTSGASVPSMLVRGTLVVGWSEGSTPARVEALLAGDRAQAGGERGATCAPDESAACEPLGGRETQVDLPLFGRVDARAVGLPVFTVLIGLVDGFNPCAMWVLLLLLALLVNVKSRLRMGLVAGVFVVISGAAYYAFMAAWLNAFLFVGISRTVQVVLGIVAVVVGAIHVKDFFAFGRGVSLSIPERAKPGIYARIRSTVNAEHLPSALVAASVLAVSVNAIELLCTAGLPALYTEVLAAQELVAWKRYAYLALYDVAYMADDTVMVVLAVATLGRRKLQERAGRWLKLLSGTVIIVLGVLLVFRPQWLTWS